MEPILFVDTFRVRDDKLEELKQAAKGIAELVEAQEPQILAYEIFIDDEERTMTGVQMHPDSASVATHMAIAGPHFGGIMACLEGGGSMAVLGSPSDQIREQMTQMAASMGVSITFRPLTAGFARLAGAS